MSDSLEELQKEVTKYSWISWIFFPAFFWMWIPLILIFGLNPIVSELWGVLSIITLGIGAWAECVREDAQEKIKLIGEKIG